MKLISSDFIDFDEQEIAALDAINTSELTTEESKKRCSRGGFHEGGKERSFSFDPLDTLRYVYPSAIECFSDVDEDTFRDAKSIIELLKENLSLWKEEEGDNIEDL